MREPRYEALYFKDNNMDVYETKDFYTKKQLRAYYEAHKQDTDKVSWWCTHRDADWLVIEDYVISEDGWID